MKFGDYATCVLCVARLFAKLREKIMTQILGDHKYANPL